jgi:hypothetical protein
MGVYRRSRVDPREQPISPIVFVLIISSFFRLIVIALMCAPASTLDRHYALPPLFLLHFPLSLFCPSFSLNQPVNTQRPAALFSPGHVVPSIVQPGAKVLRLLPGPASPRLCATHLLVCVRSRRNFIVLPFVKFTLLS